MTVSSRTAAALAVCIAALLVAGCGGGGSGGGTPGNPSNNTSVCAYTKRVGRGRVYVELSITPVSLEPTACRAFNVRFGGRRFGGSPPILPRTGRPHCGYTKSGSSSTIRLGVFSTPHTGAGRAFCRSFHPGRGFKRDFSR
jgi:hypothetical protein